MLGLGYVGAAEEGHIVIGVDPMDVKVDIINKEHSPIIGKDIAEIIKAAVAQGRLSATVSATEAVEETDLSIVCVGTPGQLNGNLDTSYVRRVYENIGSAIKHKVNRHVVAIRSTVLSGTTRNILWQKD